jgi:peptidoglycan-associated lipoprotein
MMRRISTSTEMRLVPILLTALLAFVAGCATPDAPVEDPVDTSEFKAEPPPPETNVADTRISNATVSIPPIYFDLDDSSIRSEFEPALESGAAALRESGASITIEGHCDERGSDEYNVALGERRASAVRSYLYNLGVPNDQMSAVSYGEARPAVSGTGETAWQLNRRAQITVR